VVEELLYPTKASSELYPTDELCPTETSAESIISGKTKSINVLLANEEEEKKKDT